MKISQILAKYHCDKVLGHCYGGTYNKLFAQFDRNSPLNILEIGVQKGGSLAAWAEYFPNAHIYGIDIVDVRETKYTSHDHITFVLGDVKEVELQNTFDIVIDDGSHTLPDALFTAKKYIPLLNRGGIIIIEDVQHPKSWLWHIGRVAGIWRILTGKFLYRDMRKVSGGFDDFLIIIRK